MELQLDLPPDPFSAEYRSKVFELYEWLHGRPYAPSNEATPFDVEAAADSPFPYVTHSAQTVGNHLMAVAHVIRTLDLPPGSRVVEFGPGWGNTTIALAQMGHDVTAIDIEPRFVQLIETRAERVHATVDARVGDFSMIDDLDGRYDAVLFFESFHHCADHLALLAGLDRVVAPGGRVLFAAEPITEAFPAPWGLRFEGESVWAIRRNGWLELGFKESYFFEALGRFGWTAEAVVCPDTPWGIIYVARRAAAA
jgi:protein-L-isoaspartate O-methyltransferase